MGQRWRAVKQRMYQPAATAYPSGGLPPEQSRCQFVLGFSVLRQLVGAVQVGYCIEDQHFAPNGDAQQQTTGGLLARIKNDNRTIFTDGFRTWAAGPDGLQVSLNQDGAQIERALLRLHLLPHPLRHRRRHQCYPPAPGRWPLRTFHRYPDWTKAGDEHRTTWLDGRRHGCPARGTPTYSAVIFHPVSKAARPRNPVATAVRVVSNRAWLAY
jgi:hypothetical protein